MIFWKIAVSLNGGVNWELERVKSSCLVDRSKIFVSFIFGKWIKISADWYSLHLYVRFEVSLLESSSTPVAIRSKII